MVDNKPHWMLRTGMAYALREYMEDMLSAWEFHGGYAHMPMWSSNQFESEKDCGVISTRQVLALNPQDLHVCSLIVSPHCMGRNVSTQKLAMEKCQSNLRVDFKRANLALFCCSLKTNFSSSHFHWGSRRIFIFCGCWAMFKFISFTQK